MIFTAKKSLPKLRVAGDQLSLAQQSKTRGIPLSEQTDEELASAFQKGDEQAFALLFARYKKPIYNFLIRNLGQNENSEEAFQEVFLRVVRSISDYRPSAKFSTWLYTIARNYSIDQKRKQRFRNHLSLDQPIAEGIALGDKMADQGPGTESKRGFNEVSHYLQNFLESMNPEQKEVFVLREFQHLSFDDIAKVTKVSVNTVKSRMRYAMQYLQTRFKEIDLVPQRSQQ